MLPNDGTGGTITHANGRTIHMFSASQSGSTFTPPAVHDIEVLVVGGGGGGGTERGGGGGGAGGLLHMTSYAITQPAYVVIVGYGGVVKMLHGRHPVPRASRAILRWCLFAPGWIPSESRLETAR